MKYLIFFTCLVFMSGCGNTGDQQQKSAEEGRDVSSEVSGIPAAGIRQLALSNGTVVMVSEDHPVGASLSDVRLYSAGMKDTLFVKDADPVTGVLQGDLDKDGFGEVYVVTTTAGSGSYGSIIGAASEGDSVLRAIRFPSADTNVESFEGYMGRDSFFIEGDALVRKFPLYKQDDAGIKATGGTGMVRYKLLKKGKIFMLLQSNP